jgi:hypothetical protein
MTEPQPTPPKRVLAAKAILAASSTIIVRAGARNQNFNIHYEQWQRWLDRHIEEINAGHYDEEKLERLLPICLATLTEYADNSDAVLPTS